MESMKPIDPRDVDDAGRELFEAAAPVAATSPAAESFVRAYMDAGQALDNRTLALLPALICAGIATATARRLLSSIDRDDNAGGLQPSFF